MNRKLYLVVTGGTKGIGKAILYRFVKEGYAVITCSRNKHELNQLKEDVLNLYPDAELHIKEADLSSKQEVNTFISFSREHTNQVSVLVNNTGIFLPGQIHNEEEGVLEHQIQTNLYSAYFLTRGLLPLMMPYRNGDIFNICSTASITPYTNGGSYCISKYALYGMTKVLREEMKEHQIRVTAVLPGATLTASWAGTDLPAERFIKPEDVAEAIWSAHVLSKQAVVEEILIRPQAGDIG